MRVVKVYQPPGESAPVEDFLKGLDPKLCRKLLRHIFNLTRLNRTEMREPHYKHFSLERYSDFYEIREKSQILTRIIYTIYGGDILLLMPFVKKQSRDTEKALEQSIKLLANIREHPEFAVNFNYMKEEEAV